MVAIMNIMSIGPAELIQLTRYLPSYFLSASVNSQG